MSRFTFSPTLLTGLMVLQRQPVGDERGCFERLFGEDDLQEIMLGRRIVQVNHSFTSAQGTVRGLHYQRPPHAEKKIVCCLRGEVWDVAVDVRHGSPTFLKWHGEVLNEENHRSMFIPEGFAHGFQTLSGDCTMVYIHTGSYSPEYEAALNVHDPRLAIAWPLPIAGLSPRDKGHAMITDGFSGISL